MLSISVGLQWYACRRGCPLLQRCGMLLSVSDNLRVSLMASVIPSCLRWNNCHPFSASPVVWNAVSASAWCKDGSFLTGRDQLSEPASAIYDITPFSICIPTSFFFRNSVLLFLRQAWGITHCSLEISNYPMKEQQGCCCCLEILAAISSHHQQPIKSWCLTICFQS